MTRIAIHPGWRFTNQNGHAVDSYLFELLAAIQTTGKLTLAAKEVKMSYRHTWDLLNQWSVFFGSPLVTMQRGKGAQLTTLGETLLWAEQRTEASLFPQLENIASALNIEIHRAMKATQSIIRIHASHGYAVEKLPLLVSQAGYATVDLQYMGSVAALESLFRSRCDFAGFHVPVGELAPRLRHHYEKWLRPRQQKIIRLVLRTQGLIVPRGNPRKISAVADLARPDTRFVNRQPGSGTRILLDELLRLNAVNPRNIKGYETSEFTHAAVAAFVASGMADAGFGIEPAARQFKLDFVPLMQERYMLICRNETWQQGYVQQFIASVKGPEFQEMMSRVPGYSLDSPGEVATIKDIFMPGPSSTDVGVHRLG